MPDSETRNMTPAPGWYNDPHDVGRWRWWDGSDWTNETVAKRRARVDLPWHKAVRVALILTLVAIGFGWGVTEGYIFIPEWVVPG